MSRGSFVGGFYDVLACDQASGCRNLRLPGTWSNTFTCGSCSSFVWGHYLKGAYTYSRAINMTDDDGWAGLGWNDPALISRNRAEAG